MWELPDHLMVPLDHEGEGPAQGDDVAGWRCWCGCPNAQHEYPRDLGAHPIAQLLALAENVRAYARLGVAEGHMTPLAARELTRIANDHEERATASAKESNNDTDKVE